MKTLSKALICSIAATFTLASASSMAKDVVLKPINETLETQACYLAATEGLDSAKAIVRKNRLDFAKFKATVTCNGLSLHDFAYEYGKKETTVVAETEQNKTASRVALVATNTDIASQLCLDAVVMGERAARAKYDVQESVSCNNYDLSTFVRLFDEQEVVIKNIAD